MIQGSTKSIFCRDSLFRILRPERYDFRRPRQKCQMTSGVPVSCLIRIAVFLCYSKALLPFAKNVSKAVMIDCKRFNISVGWSNKFGFRHHKRLKLFRDFPINSAMIIVYVTVEFEQPTYLVLLHNKLIPCEPGSNLTYPSVVIFSVWEDGSVARLSLSAGVTPGW